MVNVDGQNRLASGLLGEEPMLPHFRPLVVGERAAELGLEGPQCTREGLPHHGRVLGLQGAYQGKPDGPPPHRAERGRIGMPTKQVPLPMSRHRAIRPLMSRSSMLTRS